MPYRIHLYGTQHGARVSSHRFKKLKWECQEIRQLSRNNRHLRKHILAQWEAFVATQLPAAKNLDSLALRDHAPQILQAIAKDLMTPQTSKAQHEKSLGRAPKVPGTPDTAAQIHAVIRARGGFNINQLVAEYRALRASVLRLWMDDFELVAADLDDLMRFNEAIDQAVAESVDYFNTEVEQSRNLLLGMLGHDLRSPLQAIQMTASYLATLNAGETVDSVKQDGRSSDNHLGRLAGMIVGRS
ncbi:sensor histidine kinase (plasmid) [Cupriavidus sp. P-10]|nr:sensor histidine kinase [Cupriavidus sp. P-10]